MTNPTVSFEAGRSPQRHHLLWPVRAGQWVSKSTGESSGLVLGLFGASCLTVVVMFLVAITYEAARFRAAWQIIIPGVEGVGLLVPALIILGGLLCIDYWWQGTLSGIFILVSYTLLQARVDPTLVLAAHSRLDMLFIGLTLVWHVFVIPCAFLFAGAVICGLIPSLLPALANMEHAIGLTAQQRKDQKVERQHLAAQGKLRQQELQRRITQESRRLLVGPGPDSRDHARGDSRSDDGRPSRRDGTAEADHDRLGHGVG